jgi:hypothetical protein
MTLRFTARQHLDMAKRLANGPKKARNRAKTYLALSRLALKQGSDPSLPSPSPQQPASSTSSPAPPSGSAMPSADSEEPGSL